MGAEEAAKRGLVVGYDGRYNSRDFAYTTAATFISQGHTVYLMNTQLVATPFVVTASASSVVASPMCL